MTDHVEGLEGLEEDISICLWNLQLQVAILALKLPDLPQRHRNLIEDVLTAVRRWGDPTLHPVTRQILESKERGDARDPV